MVYEKTTPAGPVATVGLVLLLSLGSGAVVFVGVGLCAWACGWSVSMPMISSGLVIVSVWAVAITRLDSLWWARETVTQLTPAVEERALSRQLVSLELTEPDRGRWTSVDLPGDQAALVELARGVLAGRSLSEGEWTGQGRPYSKADFRELRGKLLERGIVTWRSPSSPSQGVTLTRAGEHVFRSLAEYAVPRTHAHAMSARLIAADELIE